MSESAAADGKPVDNPAEQEPWFTSRRWKLLAFYFGVPVVVALYGGINNWQLLKQAGLLPGLLFYIAHALPPWMITCGSTFGVMWALQRWKPNPWIIMALGTTLGAFIAQPFAAWLTGYYEVQLGIADLHDQVAPMFSAEFWRYFFSAAVMWFLVNYVFDRFLGLPRYRYTIPRGYDFKDVSPYKAGASSDSSEPLPGFLERMPVRMDAKDVLAIKAEQHYIRVYAAEREYMVLYRFSDAVRELPESLGQQVHRSYWLGYSGVDTVRPRVKKFSVKLTNGADIPVSTPYHSVVKEKARELGWNVIN